MAISFLGSSTGAGATNGNNATITLPTNQIGDVAYVFATIGSSRTPTLTVSTSVGAETFTSVLNQIDSSDVHFGVFRRILTAPRTQAIITGTGNSSDTTTGVAYVFRNVNMLTPEDVPPTSATGSGTTPDSPSITVQVSGDAIITCFAGGVSDTAVTAPSSFLNVGNGNASDNQPSTTWAAWITYNSSAPIDPAAWSGLTSATWIAATVAVEAISTAFTNFAMAPEEQTLAVVTEAKRVVVRSYQDQ